MTRLPDLANQLNAAIAQNKLYYEVYKAGKDVENELRAQIQEELHYNELKQIKTDTTTISLSQKSSLQIMNESMVIDWLNSTPNVEADAYIGVKRANLETLAKEMLKQTGELIPGTDTQYTEVLSIRTKQDNKQEKP